MISPIVAELVLWLVYIVLAIALGVTAFSEVRKLSLRQRGDGVINGVPQGRIQWLVAGGVALLLLVTRLLGDDVADMFINTSIILLIACFVGAIVSRFRS